HGRAEVRPADPDVDDVAYRPAGGALPLPEADLLGEEGHAVEDPVDLLHHVGPVDHQRGAPGHPEGDVEHRAVLGRVDRLAPPHRLDALGEAGPEGQRREQVEGLGGDAVLGVVEEQVAGLDRHRLAPLGVVGEELPQRHAGQGRMVLGQPPPLGGLGEGEGFGHRVRSSAGRRWPVSLKLSRTGEVRPRPTRVIDASPRNIRQATVPSTPSAQAAAALIGETWLTATTSPSSSRVSTQNDSTRRDSESRLSPSGAVPSSARQRSTSATARLPAGRPSHVPQSISTSRWSTASGTPPPQAPATTSAVWRARSSGLVTMAATGSPASAAASSTAWRWPSSVSSGSARPRTSPSRLGAVCP